MEWAGLELEVLAEDAFKVALAFVLAFPIGWERARGRHSPGFRTMPVVAMAACAFSILIYKESAGNVEAQARVMQGIITGIGFIGGGAIVKRGADVHGLVTAASIWSSGAIGLAVGFERTNVALILCVLSVASLWLLDRLNNAPPGR